MKALKGTGVALVTPFKSNGEVDFQGLENLIGHGIRGGLDFMVVLGTTGETPTLTEDEQHEIFKFVPSVVKGRIPLVAGHGGNDTKKLIESLDKKPFEGYHALLSASPYYNKPSQEGIYSHYAALAKASHLPIILYNVPGRTGSNVTAQTCLKLAHEFENVVAMKEASGNLNQMMEIVAHKPNDFVLLSGDDAISLPIYSIGGEGVISVIAQALPKQFCSIWNHFKSGNLAEAQKAHYEVLEITNAIYDEGNPTGIKALLEHLQICGSDLRLPAMKASPALSQKILQLLKNLPS